MAIPVTCSECGQQYNLKDEYAGKTLQCKNCQAIINVPGDSGTSSIFNRDKFLLRQKLLAISEKYYVWDEHGEPILFIKRPLHFFRNFFAILAGIISGIVAAMLPIVLMDYFSIDIQEGDPLGIVLVIYIFASFILVTMVVAVLLYKKRHILFYTDDSMETTLLTVLQNQKLEILNATFDVLDENGQLIAKFRKNYIYNILRKRWYGYAADGETLLCIAKEESIILSLLRRLLGDFFGLLRINFIILDTDDNIIGEFNRKFTLLDRYVLDMTADPQKKLDRRLALALGVLLDTGEKR